MRRLIVVFLASVLVPLAVPAQETNDQKPGAGVQPSATAQPQAPGPAVQPSSTVKPAPAVQPAAQPAPAPVPKPKPVPAPPKPVPVQPAPAKAEESGPMAWGTDYRHGSLRCNWWNADYSSRFKLVEDISGEPVGTTVDIKDILKLDTPASVWEAEVWWRPSNRNRLFLSYMFSSYTGHADILDEKIDVGGETFPVNVDVRTKLANNRGTFYYQFMPWANERGGIGPIIGIEFYNYLLELKSNATDEKVSEVFNLPIPMIGLEGDYIFGYGLGIWGKASWIGASFANISASYTNLEAGLQWKWKLLMLGVGYRALMYDIEIGEEDEDGYFRVDTDQTGVFATIGLNF